MARTPPGSQASSRGEAKDSALLSSRDAGLLEPPERPQGGLENSMDHIVHGVAKSQTRLSNFHFTSSLLGHAVPSGYPVGPCSKVGHLTLFLRSLSGLC